MIGPNPNVLEGQAQRQFLAPRAVYSDWTPRWVAAQTRYGAQAQLAPKPDWVIL